VSVRPIRSPIEQHRPGQPDHEQVMIAELGKEIEEQVE
jgi:hypothetical protein